MSLLHTFVLAAILLTTCCSAPQKVTNPSDWKGRSLQFGSGGGFTGESTVFTLLENGQLFSQTGIVNGSVKELAAIKKKKAKIFFDSASEINWPLEREIHPGNMSQTITYKESGKAHEITWGDGKYTPPAEVKNLYNDLYNILSYK
ncbi:MAG: hypothetical protein V4615_02025 [Bacteroidota bacterium]